MVRVLDVNMVAELVAKHGVATVIADMMERLKIDFTNWQEFQQIPRPAFHVEGGVLELMPTCNNEHFSFKCVNGHPKNPAVGKQTVIATGQLNTVDDGYPILISEMTLTTALRTAATSAMASDLLSRKDSQIIALIGTGAQSEYQTIAHKLIRDIKEVRYFDVDETAMTKYGKNMESNLAGTPTKLVACETAQDAVRGADIIITCTADKRNAKVLMNDWLEKGQHISALGGDCPGKTELDPAIVEQHSVVVELLEQTVVEGEIQAFPAGKARSIVDAELHQVVRGSRKVRENDDQITVFDGVGIALEDFSALNVMYKLSEKYNIGGSLNMIPDIDDPKNLFSVLLNN